MKFLKKVKQYNIDTYVKRICIKYLNVKSENNDKTAISYKKYICKKNTNLTIS